MTTVYDFEARTIDGKPAPLADYKGRVLLIVNTASECGFTPQFAGLEKLHERYADKGLTVLGFPSNQFLNQDPGSNEEIGAFCTKNYGVTFPMMEKIEVKEAAPRRSTSGWSTRSRASWAGPSSGTSPSSSSAATAR